MTVIHEASVRGTGLQPVPVSRMKLPRVNESGYPEDRMQAGPTSGPRRNCQGSVRRSQICGGVW